MFCLYLSPHKPQMKSNAENFKSNTLQSGKNLVVWSVSDQFSCSVCSLLQNRILNQSSAFVNFQHRKLSHKKAMTRFKNKFSKHKKLSFTFELLLSSTTILISVWINFSLFLQFPGKIGNFLKSFIPEHLTVFVWHEMAE